MRITNHLVEGVEYLKTPNMSGTLKPEGIVLHDTAGRLDAGSSVAWLRNPAAKASAHLVNELGGSFSQLAPFNVQTWHAGRSRYKGRRHCNRFTIGIEIVNPGKLDEDGRAWFGEVYPQSVFRQTPEHGAGRWLPYQPEQIETTIAQCIAIRDAYDIKFITTHWFISPGRKIDTNPLFPLDHVISRVFGRADPDDEATEWDAWTTTNVHMRRWPSRSSRIIKLIDRGAPVEIIRSGVWDDERWFLVHDEAHDQGWVHGAYIDID